MKTHITAAPKGSRDKNGNYMVGKQVMGGANPLSSGGCSHVAKDNWRQRANARELVVVRTKAKVIH